MIGMDIIQEKLIFLIRGGLWPNMFNKIWIKAS